MVRRKAILGLVALIAATGCNAGNSGGLKRQEPPIAKETISKARIIAQHNKNAATIQSLKAAPSIVFSAEDQKGKLNQGKLNGRMAMEREKDFRLEISSTLHKQADIGSNSQGFWFWVRDNQEKAIYVCDYDHVNASPLAVTMQPDWILEAMGLREISEREASTISASKGDKAGQLVLTQLRSDSKGGTLTKVTVVDESSGEILEHRLYSGAKEKLLARATISESRAIEMEKTEADPNGSVVTIPAKLKLEWLVEKFSLDITMAQTTINPQFPKEQRVALFTEPQINGATRTDLARIPGAAAATSSRIYESAPRSGVRLGNPEAEPFGIEGASQPTRDTQPLAAALPPLPSSAYVGPQIPRAPEPEGIQTSAGPGWGGATFNR